MLERQTTILINRPSAFDPGFSASARRAEYQQRKTEGESGRETLIFGMFQLRASRRARQPATSGALLRRFRGDGNERLSFLIFLDTE